MKVNFFIVGQPKSGTTALANFLDQHPELCISIPKEPGFMAKDLVEESRKFHGSNLYFRITKLSDYLDCFSHAKPKQVLGESSTMYLHSRVAAKEIKKHNENAKIIIMLRNPADMIYSLHSQYVNETGENIKEFEEALKKEPERKAGIDIPSRIVAPSYTYYLERARYYEQLKRFFNTFNKKNVHIIFSEDFRQNNAKEYRRVLKFLGIKNADFRPDFINVHGSKKPRLKYLHKLAHNTALKTFFYKLLGKKHYTYIQKKYIEPALLKKSPRPQLQDATRQYIYSEIKKDIDKSSRLINDDLAKRWSIN